MVTPQIHDWAICSCRSCQKFKNRVERKRRTMELLALSPDNYNSLVHSQQMKQLGLACHCIDCQIARVIEARALENNGNGN